MTKFEQIISEQDGRPILGVAVHRYNPDFLEMMAMMGFKAVWIEMEHAHLRFDEAVDLCRIAAGLGILSMIRIPAARRDIVSHAAECGPDMIDVPMVESAQTARDLVIYAKYPPQGKRGFYCRSRAEGFAINTQLKDVFQEINDNLSLVVQIETKLGFENAEEICATPGIDAIFVGRGDLSLDLGVACQVDHPEVCRITEEIIRLAKHNGKRVIIPGAPHSAAHWKAKGADLLFIGSDTSCMTDGLRRNYDAVQESYDNASSNPCDQEE